MKNYETVVLLGLLLLFPTTSRAADGNWLARKCNTTENSSISACERYVSGVTGGLREGVRTAFLQEGNADLTNDVWEQRIQKALGYCLPRDVTLQQTVSAVSKYLARYPAMQHLPAPFLVKEALRSSFPC